MSTLSVRVDREAAKYKSGSKSVTKPKIKTNLKKAQQEEFKEGLKEAVLISRGEIEGTPLSELWDE
jgi:hypothetical protein